MSMIWLVVFTAVLVMGVLWANGRYKKHGGTRNLDHMGIASEHDLDLTHHPWTQSEPGGHRERPRE
jgi:hypothetical protein